MHEANEDRVNPFPTLFRLLGAGVVAGVLLAFIALPGVGSAGLTARDAADNFQNMESDLKTTPPSEKTVMYDAAGKPVATFFDRYRESIRLDQVAPIMRKAIIDIEDARFYEHGALDLKGTLRALASNVESDQTQGGSTLTQQYVKNLLADSAKTKEEYQEATAPTVGRKVRELRYALDVEQRMTKDEILQGYLNIAYFGSGAYGVQAAAKRYFSKPAAKLKLGEAALLAGITQNPAAWDPIRNPNDARTRRDVVLNRMAELGTITPAQAKTEIDKPIHLNRTEPVGGCQMSDAPFFCQYAMYDALNLLSKGKYWSLNDTKKREVVNDLNRGGYSIRTTLDRKAQRSVDQALRNIVSPSSHKVGAQAMVEPGTGNVRAIGLSKRFGSGKGRTTINLPANSAHGGGVGVSAGSTFKIFTLLAALDQGIPVNTSIAAGSNTVLNGMRDCKGGGFGPWPVKNSDPAEKGAYNLKTGTWMSVNTFYAHLEKRVGLCDSVKMAERFGLRQASGAPLQQVPSQVLGTNEIDMVSLASAYAGIAARGKYCAPVSITEITDNEGKKLKLPKAKCDQVVDRGVADQANSIMQGVFDKGTARGRSIGRPAAGKTGTCEAHTCAVFAGHTPIMASSVAYWDPRGQFKYPVYGVYGADQPAAIWQQAMRTALAGRPAPGFTRPTGDFGDTATVPDVVGLSIGEATTKLQAADFEVHVSPKPVRSSEPKGTVASTSPSAGTEAPLSSVVTIYMSNGDKDENEEGDEPNEGEGFFRWPWD
ncbi:penicillin-binding protein [Actinomadura flavalba]|uniref:penicillin-binding protein n=1 Tax=Actinomadura flavalba TaxID=1120938 RepID=UPI0003A3EF14|nr:transglycosylase domain-containing protein [Actinomadura flavalba]